MSLNVKTEEMKKMKGKTILSLAIALSMLASMMPLVAVRAQPMWWEVVFENGMNTITKTFGSSFVATVKIHNAPASVQWVCDIEWNPTVLDILLDTDVVEGPWLKGSPARATMFLVKPINHVAGNIPEITDLLMVAGTSSGDGDLMYITFKAIGFGDSPVTITDPKVLDEFGTETPPAYVINGDVLVPTPPPTPPVAHFTPDDGTMFFVGDTIALDGSASEDGIDTWPVPPGAENEPITDWQWDIDYGNDGSIDLTLHGETNSFVCPGPGLVGITLTVTAPDLTPPTQTYVDHDSEKHVINQITIPVGPSDDVYTDRGGTGPLGTYPFGWSDAYGPQEMVTAYCKVTYNDEPVEYKPNAFELIDPNGVTRDYRVAFTGADGIATVTFRIPWEGSNAEDLFGVWSIVSTVDVAGTIVTDTVKFKFGYILSIRGIEVLGSPLYKGEVLTVNVDIQSISMAYYDVLLTIVAADECGVPVGLATDAFSVWPEDGMSLGNTITIPTWAFVGTGTLYVNLFTKAPSAGGVAYCPERTAIWILLKTP
jgi:hypothetical protein